MGFHVCEYCANASSGTCGWAGKRPGHRFFPTSSGDVILKFASGRSYVVPDMILHYIVDHEFLPPAEFIADVISGKLVDGGREQTRGLAASLMRVGYLHGDFPRGEVPENFVSMLESTMDTAATRGGRLQSKGM